MHVINVIDVLGNDLRSAVSHAARHFGHSLEGSPFCYLLGQDLELTEGVEKNAHRGCD